MSARSRSSLAPLLATGLLALGMLSGCSDDAADRAVDPSADRPEELAAHDGEVCPAELPEADDEHGFGTREPADSAPSLETPESAWVCVYNAVDVAGEGAEGASYAWVRRGEATAVPDTALGDLAADLDALEPAADHRMCTADLGPRWMLVTVVGGDLTGVVVDGFGCGEVRLTDEPFTTVPGEASASGTVPGVLTGPDGLLPALQAMAG
ncbi:hypothetical protein [Nocardioides sp.]|uniref:hypothetical protein n=1 Tax=Nocardioides sp. TaxID=35761 RepID=UPI00286D13C1|nr:hypothetical protein [Nocardioides sp.]